MEESEGRGWESCGATYSQRYSHESPGFYRVYAYVCLEWSYVRLRMKNEHLGTSDLKHSTNLVKTVF